MATLQTITGPSQVAAGTTVKFDVGITNADEQHVIKGVDENGVRVTWTFNKHEDLTFTIVPLAQAIAQGGKAPAGTMVFWTDDPVSTLSVDPANPVGALDLAVA